jgi:sugar/nucleoside kinase (ribokinase family)
MFDTEACTALLFVELRADGTREFMFYRNSRADMILTAYELNVELIKRLHTLALVLIISMTWGLGSAEGIFFVFT